MLPVLARFMPRCRWSMASNIRRTMKSRFRHRTSFRYGRDWRSHCIRFGSKTDSSL